MTSIIQELIMGKCNEVISKMMMMMVKIPMKVAIFHVDSEEQSALAISCSPVAIKVIVCIVDIIIIDTIKIVGIIGDDVGIK